jgi:hypothetical protein
MRAALGAAGEVAPAGHRRAPVMRVGVLVGPAAVVLAGALLVAVRPAAAPTVSPVPLAAPAPPVQERWGRLLEELDARRAEAFAAADPRRLDFVWAPGSAGLLADVSAVRALAVRGLVAQGVRHDLLSVALLEPGASRVRLRVVDVLPAHLVTSRTTGRAGQHERVDGRGAAVHEVVVVRVGERWLLSEVRLLPPSRSAGQVA